MGEVSHRPETDSDLRIATRRPRSRSREPLTVGAAMGGRSARSTPAPDPAGAKAAADKIKAALKTRAG